MDALDLLFRRIVLAAQAAGALGRPVDVGEILDKLAPYHAARRDGLIEDNDHYMHTVMQLLAGARSYIFADELLQDDLLAELASPNPDLTIPRAYINTKVQLSTEGVSRILAGDGTIDLSPPTPTQPVQRTTVGASAATRESQVRTTPGDIAAAPGKGNWKRTDTAALPPSTTGNPHPACPYCAQNLPEGRPVKFCPSCGLNLLVRRCSGCSAEIESGWKFCITCGRSAQ